MSIQGSCLSHPIRPDLRGMLAAVSDRSEMVADSIKAIIETRVGERVMLPDYGLPDFVFEVMDAGFVARLAYFITRQVRRYEPLVDRISLRGGALNEGQFVPGHTPDRQRAAIQIEYTVRGSNTPRNLVFPTWALRT